MCANVRPMLLQSGAALNYMQQPQRLQSFEASAHLQRLPFLRTNAVPCQDDGLQGEGDPAVTYTVPNVLVTTDWVAGHAKDTGVHSPTH